MDNRMGAVGSIQRNLNTIMLFLCTGGIAWILTTLTHLNEWQFKKNAEDMNRDDKIKILMYDKDHQSDVNGDQDRRILGLEFFRDNIYKPKSKL